MSSSAVKWWEKEPEPEGVWRALVTDDGLDYYFNTETNETSWEKPVELMTEEEINSTGDWLWVPDEDEVYKPAKLLAYVLFGGARSAIFHVLILMLLRYVSIPIPGRWDLSTKLSTAMAQW